LATGIDEEWRRLQALYAAMSDDELLRLAGDKSGLTEVAQQSVEAEMSSRGLKLDEETEAEADAVFETPELDAAEDDPSLVGLKTFQIASEAEMAARLLDDHGIPVRMEQAVRRFTKDGPKIKTNWLTVFVEQTRQEEAIGVLRAGMGLFPVLQPEEVKKHDDADDGESEEEPLAIVGNFGEAADIAVARKALTDAGIWFEVDEGDEEEGTMIRTRLEDLERALEVVEEAFDEEKPN
jgi:hypothetical protein